MIYSHANDQMLTELEKAHTEIERLRWENAELRKRSETVTIDMNDGRRTGDLELSFRTQSLKTLSSISTVQEKIKLFHSLFRGREDVYALFWTNERNGKKGYSPACEDPWS